ncbi:MAG TPA: dual specificity protein phosphatase family protein [Candidatus Sulfotelmatobacter sp.]|jgi:protein-tyrosine phosphatase
MPAGLYWIDGPWPGKLAVAARPRGGDWLRDELETLKRAGVGAILSLLTPEEERDLDLREEAAESRRQGVKFISFPIPDRQVPSSEAKLGKTLEKLASLLSQETNVLVHCRQGIGRSGLVAACLLVKNGMSPGAALDAVSGARGIPVPETAEQREWIERYAPAFAK